VISKKEREKIPTTEEMRYEEEKVHLTFRPSLLKGTYSTEPLKEKYVSKSSLDVNPKTE